MTFDDALDLILTLEGGDTNDPRDPGGLTRFGIAQAAHPGIDVANLTKAGAAEIYKSKYWRPLRCADMPPGLAVAVFDCGVNQGTTVAARLLQRAAGTPEDGVVGPRTLTALSGASARILDDFMARRAVRYADTARFDVYGRGWMTRLFVVHREAVLRES